MLRVYHVLVRHQHSRPLTRRAKGSTMPSIKCGTRGEVEAGTQSEQAG